ncbi:MULTISPECIES: hypothetical protein [unclassified Serratia (in: enterobacteria)]|uniref:hypothetical protein n=1 Tax=unclassified Serratia (in: enterobacteria) TaxID=2647522 RepID=UPI0018A8FD94|nr:MULTISPECIES: hypothetical protein [unclassified Serratia (in: enterobacteria)]
MDIFDKTSADKKSIGFFYQDYVALKYLLELKPGESIGIEVFDDIHLENISGDKILIQVKHTIDYTNNLTNKDGDLWKTLYNWSEAIKVINDRAVSLIFYTNKALTQRDGIVQLLAQSQKDIEKIKKEVKIIKESYKGKSDELYKHLTAIDSLTNLQAEKLFKSITFIHSDLEIIEQIKTLLQMFSIPENKIDDTFHSISGALAEYKYKLIKNNNKVIISYDDFRKKTGADRIIQISRNCINNFDQYYNFESAYPTDLDKRTSYKQLQDINFNSNNAVQFINYMAKTDAFFQSLINDGELTKKELELIYQKVFSEWQVKHALEYLGSDYSVICDSHIDIATALYKELIKCNICIENNDLPREMVMGSFLKLSDKPDIGWLQHWESLYK